LQKKKKIQLINISGFFCFNFFNQKNGTHNWHKNIMFVKLMAEFLNRRDHS
jgi:hypothetical protein